MGASEVPDDSFDVVEISVREVDGVEVVGSSVPMAVGVGIEVDGSSEPIAVGVATVVGAAVEEKSVDDARVLVVAEAEIEAETDVEAEIEVEGETEVEALLVLTTDVDRVSEEVFGEAEVDSEWAVDDASEGVALATEVAEVDAARVLVRSLVGDGDADGEGAALEETDAFEVVTEGVAGLACAVGGRRDEDMDGTSDLLNVHVPSEEEWGPSRFNAGDLKKGAMTKERRREEGETALCLWAGRKVHAER